MCPGARSAVAADDSKSDYYSHGAQAAEDSDTFAVGVSAIDLPEGAVEGSAIGLAEGAPDIEDDAIHEPAFGESIGGRRGLSACRFAHGV
jgi:hypothetical protein